MIARTRRSGWRTPKRLLTAALSTVLATAGLLVATAGVASASQHANTVTVYVADNSAGWTLNNTDDGSSGSYSGDNFTYGDSVTIFACSSTSGTGDQEITISDGNGTFGTYNAVVTGSGCVSGYSFTANNTHFGDDWVASSGGNSQIAATASSWTSVFEVSGYSGPSLGNGGNTVTFGQDASFCLPFSGGNIGGDNWSGSGAPPGMGYDGNNCYSGTPNQPGSWSGSITDTEYDGAGNGYSTTGYWTVTANSSPPYWTSAPGTATVVNGTYYGNIATFSANSGDASGVSYSTSGLPAGLGLSGGTIYGTPSTTTGAHTFTVYASNDGGTISAGFTLTVEQVPAFTSGASATFAAGTSSSFSGSASGYPTPGFSESGTLPSGVSFVDHGNGTFSLSGTPATGSAGTWPVTITASNGVGSPATQSFVLTVSESSAFTGVFATVAGTGTTGSGAAGGAALSTNLGGDEESVATDAAGDVFFADASNNTIDEIPHASGTQYGIPMTAGHVYVVAGNGSPGYAGDGNTATLAELDDPRGVAVDAAGDLFIADTGNNRIREVPAVNTTSPNGIDLTAGDIYTIAGNGTAAYYGDDGPASGSKVSGPIDVALDSAGDIFVADSGNNVVRMIAVTSGPAFGQTVAAGDIYTIGSVTDPVDLATDAAGDVFVTPWGQHTVDMIPVANGTHFTTAMTAGTVYVIGGNGTSGTSGNGNAATSAEFASPFGIAVDAAGDVYVADAGNQDLREIAATNATNWGIGMATGDVYQLSSNLGAVRGIASSSSGALYLTTDSAEVRVLGLPAGITSANSATFSANLAGTFTATATGSPTPTWTVSPPGGLPSGLTLSSSGTLSGTPALGTAGTYSVTLYASNGVGSVASQSFTLTVEAAATSLALSVSPATPVVAATATVTVAVTPIPDAGTTVAITDAKGYFDCPAASVSSVTGLATCTSSTITSVASDLVSASFGGDVQYAASAGTLTVVPDPASTSVVVIDPSGAPTALTTTTLRATVSPIPDGGTVAFSDGEGYVAGCGSEPVNLSTGVATCTTGTLSAPGADTFSATYSGDSDYLASPTASLPITIGKAITTVTITTSPSTFTVDSFPTVVATVSGPDGPVDGGTVGFSDTEGYIYSSSCSAIPLTASVADCALAKITSVTPDTVTAAYAGDALYAPATAVSSLVPGLFPTSLSVTSSSPALVVGQTTTLTATLDQIGLGGTVSFSDSAGLVTGCGGVAVTAVTASTSTATCTTSSPTSTGSDTITVTYAGDANDAGVSQSVTLPIDTEPSLTSATSFTTATGDAFSTTVTTGGSPSVVAITNDGGTLPAGLSLHDNGDGTATISGTVGAAAGGVYSYGIALDDGVLGPVTESLSFTVDQAASFTTSSSGTCVAGSACDISVATAGYPLPSLGVAATLPSGLSFVAHANGTAEITGTADAAAVGTTNFTIAATSPAGNATQQFTLTVSPAPVTIITTTGGSGSSGSSGSSSSGSSSSGSSSSSGGDGNSATGSATPVAGTVTGYAVAVRIGGTLNQNLGCAVPASAVHSQAKNGTLTAVGFTIHCASGSVTSTLVASIDSITTPVMERSTSGKLVEEKKKNAAGKMVVVTKTAWVGGIRLSEPSRHLTVTLTPQSARVNRNLVLSGSASGVVTTTVKVQKAHTTRTVKHSYKLTWTIQPTVAS